VVAAFGVILSGIVVVADIVEPVVAVVAVGIVVVVGIVECMVAENVAFGL
jgi:hypothetical protein